MNNLSSVKTLSVRTLSYTYSALIQFIRPRSKQCIEFCTHERSHPHIDIMKKGGNKTNLILRSKDLVLSSHLQNDFARGFAQLEKLDGIVDLFQREGG